MLLMDSITQTSNAALSAKLEKNPLLSIYTDLGQKLDPATGPKPPRFAFDPKAILTATELTLGRPKVFREVMRHLILPYSNMWIEWEDAGRAILRQKLKDHHPELQDIRPLPSRMGFLIEADPGFRSGRITWAWKMTESDIPNISPITAIFDLDGDFSIDRFKQHPLSLAELWDGNPLQQNELFDIWRTVEHVANEPAVAYMEHATPRELLFADVVGEYIMIWACLILLTASRQSVDLRDADISRLNKQRQKSKKPLLLDHRTVHINLGKQTSDSRPHNPLDYRRKSPRVHLVSSYIGRRGKLYWPVFPYTRGVGKSGVTRTTHIH